MVTEINGKVILDTQWLIKYEGESKWGETDCLCFIRDWARYERKINLPDIRHPPPENAQSWPLEQFLPEANRILTEWGFRIANHVVERPDVLVMQIGNSAAFAIAIGPRFYMRTTHGVRRAAGKMLEAYMYIGVTK